MERKKRKKCCPKRLSVERQNELAWDLTDLSLKTSLDDGEVPYLQDFAANSTRTACTTKPKLKRRKHSNNQNDPIYSLFIKTSFPGSWHCVLGSFHVALNESQNANILEQQCRVSIDMDTLLDEEIHTNGDASFLPDTLRDLSMEGRPVVPDYLLEALVYLQRKQVLFFVLSTSSTIFDTSWDVMVCLCESALTNLKFSSQDTTMRKTDKMIKVVMQYFYHNQLTISDDICSDVEQVVNGFDELYKAVMEKKIDTQCNVEISDDTSDSKSLQHPDLKPMLRGYQWRAVKWMIGKEKCDQADNTQESDLHVLWRRCITVDKKILFYNPFNGRLTTKCFPQPAKPLGGILADEMGLGKTVEVLACILNNPKPQDRFGAGGQQPLIHDTSEVELQSIRESIVDVPVGQTTQNGRCSSIAVRQSTPSKAGQAEGIQPIKSSTLETAKHTQSLSGDDKEQLKAKNPVTNNILEAAQGTSSKGAINSEQFSQTVLCNSTKRTQHFIVDDEDQIANDTLEAEKRALSIDIIHDNQVTQPVLSNIHDTTKPTQSLSINNKEDKQEMLCIKRNTSEETQSIDYKATVPMACKLDIAHHTQYLPVDDSYEDQTVKPSTSHSLELLHPTASLPVAVKCAEQVTKSETCIASDIVAPIVSLPISHTCSEQTSQQPACKTLKTTTLPVEQSIMDKDQVSQQSKCNSSEAVQTPQTLFKGSARQVKCECICGAVEVNEDVVQCSNCSICLHAKCFKGFKAGFLCPKCSVNRPPIPSRTTLIISPETIVQQWVQEITRHITQGALKLMVYEGVSKQGFICPEVLIGHDIILTTYTTLRTEFHHLGKEDGRYMRYQKRYMAIPSPLTAINFWRVCLDEAQMVETTTAKAAEMALQLHCVHRWCVTGTPIQKGLEDIYGLLLFLGAYPYCQKVWWKKLLCDPYMAGHKEPMYNVLSGLLWRTAKNDVLDEIQIPSQTEHLISLKFTPVEEHFYRRQHEECSSWALRMLSQFGKADMKLNSLDRHTVHKMLIPLLRLRQACCHPQAVRGGFLSIHKSTLTMEQLLENLIAKAKLECEEAHRQLLFSFNGLAGIHVIKEEFAAAVDLYRESMHSWMDHEKFFRTDKLQKLHTLHNLNEILSYGYPGCSHTLRDDKLKDEIDAHIQDYMLKPNTQVQTALTNLEEAKKRTQELKAKVDKASAWWVLAIDCTLQSERRGLDEELMKRLEDQLSFMENGTILGSFTDWRGLQYILTAKLEKMKWSRECLVKALDGLCVEPSPSLVQSTALCCLRSQPNEDNQSNRCQFCQVDNIFSEYESRLFGHQGIKGNTGEINETAAADAVQFGNTGGLRAETDTEKALKILFAFIKHYGLAYEVHQDAIDHLAFIEALRKEFKILRAAWFALRERVSSMDELDMCTTRLRLAHPCERVSELDNHVIQPCQVSQQKLKFTSDRIVARTELRKRLGQFVYLTNLSKKSNKGENPETCPVCTKELGREWSVFSCGHCYCCQCVWVLVRNINSRSGQVKCPVCRAPTMTAEISYVSSGNEQNSIAKGVFVKGSHSTKVEAIVRTLLMIAADDNTAKCLVFSTWQDVLELIGRALVENDVPFRHITCTRRLQFNLDKFKNDTTVNVVLLPLQTGSNGLNIIEATHVLLVEPALNPAHEQQAIGRVHRIGQTKPTHVHRFVIEHTVESRMYSLLHAKSTGVARTGCKDTENPSLTIADLATLFNHDEDLESASNVL